MSTGMTVCLVLLLIWFGALGVAVFLAEDIQIYKVGNRTDSAGGTEYIPRIRYSGHKFAKVQFDEPNNKWSRGDLLIYAPKFDFYRQGHYYIFRKFERRDANPFYPTAVVFKCTEYDHVSRPKFEKQLGAEWECIGEVHGVRVNGKNILYA